MQHDTGFCAALPVHTVTAWAEFCTHHQAWTAFVDVRLQHSGDRVDVLEHRALSFGPFDTAEDVRLWMIGELLTLEAFRPGGPGSAHH